MHSVMAAVAAKHPQGTVLTVDIDQDPATADRFNVHSIPCVVTLVNGQEVERHYGSRSVDEVNAQMDGHGGAAPLLDTGGIMDSVSSTFDSIFNSGQPSQAQVTAAAADVQLAATGHPAASPEAQQFVQTHADSNGWTAADTAAVAGSAAGALGLGLTFLLSKQNSTAKPRKKVAAPALTRQPQPIMNSGASSLWKIGIALAVLAGAGVLFFNRRK
jgi:hypothetical protein